MDDNNPTEKQLNILRKMANHYFTDRKGTYIKHKSTTNALLRRHWIQEKASLYHGLYEITPYGLQIVSGYDGFGLVILRNDNLDAIVRSLRKMLTSNELYLIIEKLMVNDLEEDESYVHIQD